MLNKRITTLLWDADNTLLDFDYSMRNSLIECFKTYNVEATEEMLERYSEINDSYWKRLERGEITKKDLLKNRFRDLLIEYKLDYIDYEAFRSEFQEHLGTIYSYLDDSLNICKALKKSYKQYVVTNGVASTQYSKLGLSGFLDVMDGIFVSDEIGFNKPDQRFFLRCLDKLEEKDKERILIIGDSLTSDIKGGNNAGIKTCWYNPKRKEAVQEYKIDYELRNLNQIFKILERD